MKITAYLVLILSAWLLAACQPQVNAVPATPTPTAPPEITPTPTLVPTPNAGQSRQAIIAGLLAMYVKASHIDVTTVGEDGSATNTLIEFLPPDRKYISSGGVEYIVVGGKVYMKTASKGWFVAPMSAALFITDPPTAEGIDPTISDAHLLRKDTLNGKDMWVYGFTITNKTDALTLVNKAELWVSLADGLPAKYITDGDTYGVSTQSDGSSKAVTSKAVMTTLINFNAPIKIDAPVP